MFKQVPRTSGTGCYYLNSVSAEGQEMYLRFDQTARRPPYRTSRILARHQLLTKIQQGELLAEALLSLALSQGLQVPPFCRRTGFNASNCRLFSCLYSELL